MMSTENIEMYLVLNTTLPRDRQLLHLSICSMVTTNSPYCRLFIKDLNHL